MCYRAVAISFGQLENYQKNVKKLVVIQGFQSTSENENTSVAFFKGLNREEAPIKILYHIDVPTFDKI